MKAKIKRKIKKPKKRAIKWASANFTGWFAKNKVLATLVLFVLSFAAGAIFVFELSKPIAENKLYNYTTKKIRLAEQGVKTFSQYVIDVTSPVFTALVKNNRESNVFSKREIAERKEILKKYLQGKDSPFAEDEEALEAFAASTNMKLMVAISFVESTFGKNCYFYNCSGIGGTPPNLRRYESYSEWITDFDKLLEESYQGLAPEEFIGFYVQPGSANWLYGVNQILDELEDLGIMEIEN